MLMTGSQGATFLLLIFLLTGCESLKQSAKYSFSEGWYRSRMHHKKLKNIYVVRGDDSIKVYTKKSLSQPNVDSISALKIAFPANKKPADFGAYSFRRGSFDVDVLSILFKYRPPVHGFPNQLNTSLLNGALYAGYRMDFYKLRYNKTPLADRRSVTHYACSFGVFSGLGATTINESVTNNAVNIDYDGVVNPSGIAAIVAIDKLSFGLLSGIDLLLDKNRKYWIYRGRPWLGLSVGLNLN